MNVYTPNTDEIVAVAKRLAVEHGSFAAAARHFGLSRNVLLHIANRSRACVSYRVYTTIGLDPSEVRWLNRKQLMDEGYHQKVKTGTKAVFLNKNGVLHKLCAGKTHRVPTFVPVKRFYLIKAGPLKGKPRSQCADCERARRGMEELTPYARYQPFVVELVNRLGKMEATRRIGISQQGLWQLLNGQRTNLYRPTARKIILALQEVRASGEVRHKDSIHHGAYLRGRAERSVEAKSDLYRPHGDTDSERKRRERAA